MHNLKKLAVILVVIAMVFACTGCLIQVNEEKNNAIVVATVNGVEILKSEFIKLYNIQLSYYEQSYEDFATSSQYESARNSIKLSILDTLVSDELVRQHMEKDGYSVNDDDKKKAQEDIEKTLEEYKQELIDADIEDKGSKDDTKDYDKLAHDELLRVIKANGYTEEEYLAEGAMQFCMERYKDSLLKDITSKEDDIVTYYNDNLKSQKDKLTLTADVQIYTPSGINYKVAVISFTQAQQAEYKALIDAGKTSDAAAYKSNTLLTKANALLARVKNGESIDTIINELIAAEIADGTEEDKTINNTKEYKKFRTVASGIAGTFDDAITAIQAGDVTDVLESEDKYIFGYNAGRFDENTRTLDECKEEIRELLDEELHAEEWTDLIETWASEADITKHKNRVLKNY
ncbi:MAG: hypothetical protein E7315_03250 [Clostridiales bacterium]|nr:hypothetical protein [Clostridiales bacterium]